MHLLVEKVAYASLAYCAMVSHCVCFQMSFVGKHTKAKKKDLMDMRLIAQMSEKEKEQEGAEEE